MNDKFNLNNKNNRNNINIDERLESLKKIRKVDAPPYLFTRIKAEIDSFNNLRTEAPVQWKWAFAVTAIAIIILNISIMFKTDVTGINTSGIDKIVTTMHLSNNNDLYPNYENE